MTCYRSFIMDTPMVMRRKPSTQKPRTIVSGTILPWRWWIAALKQNAQHLIRIHIIWFSVLKVWVQLLTYNIAWFAVVVQHSSTIKNKIPSFPVGSQIGRSLWKISLSNDLNLNFVHRMKKWKWTWTRLNIVLASNRSQNWKVVKWSAIYSQRKREMYSRIPFHLRQIPLQHLLLHLIS